MKINIKRSTAILKKYLLKHKYYSILGIAATLYVLFTKRKYCRIFFDKVWLHRYYKFGYLADLSIGYFDIKELQKEIEDNWLVVYEPKVGDIIIDIGAGVGMETYYFSKLVGSSGRIIALEANPEICLCLEQQCNYNKLDNVKILNIAVSDSAGEVIINHPHEHVSSTIINSKSGFTIPSNKLDSIIEPFNFETIDFIKMNIEGAEKLVIKGMENTIKMTKNICISCHDFRAEKESKPELKTKEEIVAFLTRNDFKITTREFHKKPWIRDQINAVNLKLCS